jgi:hypothetical protein
MHKCDTDSGVGGEREEGGKLCVREQYVHISLYCENRELRNA